MGNQNNQPYPIPLMLKVYADGGYEFTYPNKNGKAGVTARQPIDENHLLSKFSGVEAWFEFIGILLSDFSIQTKSIVDNATTHRHNKIKTNIRRSTKP